MAERRAVSAEELARHTAEDDCWVSCHGLVLDLGGSFLQEHPGGPDVILGIAGQDVTDAFEDTLHSNSAREWADKRIIGFMEGADESARTKLLPKEAKPGHSDGARGDGGGMLPALGAVVIGVVAVAFVLLRVGRR